MLEAEHLFSGCDTEGLHNNRYHVNEMVSLLGDPSEAFLRRSPHASRLFDENGRSTAITSLIDVLDQCADTEPCD